MATTESMRTRVRLRLEESVEAVWSDDAIDEFVLGALDTYSWTFPHEFNAEVDVADGATSIPMPYGARAIQRVTLASGTVTPLRGNPTRSTSAEELAWETFADQIHFSQPLAAQTVTLWYTGAVSLTTLPAADEALVILDAVAHLLQARAVQDFKRGGPLGGPAYDAVITRANKDYASALTQRRRRVRGSYVAV